MPDRPIIPPHGGYRGLEAFKLAEFIHDGTVVFCERCIDPRSRTKDQMVQAARSGKQNIAEGSQFSGTSKKLELTLSGAARASLEELLLDYTDYLRQKGLALWPKDHERAVFIRNLARNKDKSYSTYKPYIEEKSEETAANTLICLIHQASYLLDQLIRRLEKDFVEEGGFTERLHKARTQHRSNQSDPPKPQ